MKNPEKYPKINLEDLLKTRDLLKNKDCFDKILYPHLQNALIEMRSSYAKYEKDDAVVIIKFIEADLRKEEKHYKDKKNDRWFHRPSRLSGFLTNYEEAVHLIKNLQKKRDQDIVYSPKIKYLLRKHIEKFREEVLEVGEVIGFRFKKSDCKDPEIEFICDINEVVLTDKEHKIADEINKSFRDNKYSHYDVLKDYKNSDRDVFFSNEEEIKKMLKNLPITRSGGKPKHITVLYEKAITALWVEPEDSWNNDLTNTSPIVLHHFRRALKNAYNSTLKTIEYHINKYEESEAKSEVYKFWQFVPDQDMGEYRKAVKILELLESEFTRKHHDVPELRKFLETAIKHYEGKYKIKITSFALNESHYTGTVIDLFHSQTPKQLKKLTPKYN